MRLYNFEGNHKTFRTLLIPDDKISNAFKMNNVLEIKKLITEISSDVDFIWIL